MISVKAKIENLGFKSAIEIWHDLISMAKLTALRKAPDGTYYLSNWWRGPLLYALVSYYKPKNVLEFGTGRGYGAISMAKAGVDQGFDCTVWTIDIVPTWKPQLWPIDEGSGPTTKYLSLEEVWQKYLPTEIRNRIRCLTGDSYSVMRMWNRKRLPPIDFFFIDGGHDYWTVKHDFIAALKVANPGAVFVFDDYGSRRVYGIKRLIDEEILPKSPPGSVEIIDTLAERARPKSEDLIEHKMVLVDTHEISNIQTHFYSTAQVKFYMIAYYIIRIRRVIVYPLRFLSKSGLRILKNII